MNLIDVERQFATEEACREYLVKLRWPKGVRCVKCGGKRISEFDRKGKSGKSTHVYQCLLKECSHQFSATVGTIFEDTHLPLTKWFMAIALMLDAKKGVSAMQMQRHLGVAYKTAWHLCHRIRKAMEDGQGGLFTGKVEIDETYVGGKYDKRRKRQRWDKIPVFGILERGGKVRAVKVEKVNRYLVLDKIKDAVSPSAEAVYTDDSHLYDSLGKLYKHDSVNHSNKEYVRGDVHTCYIDGFWGLFKRGLIGSFHQVSIKRLDRYLTEFSYRYNHREHADLFRATMIGLLAGIALRYAELTADPSEAK